MDKFNALKAQIAEMEKDAIAFYTKGTKAAGTRLRVGMQTVKTMAQEIRNEVTELKNNKED